MLCVPATDAELQLKHPLHRGLAKKQLSYKDSPINSFGRGLSNMQAVLRLTQHMHLERLLNTKTEGSERKESCCSANTQKQKIYRKL